MRVQESLPLLALFEENGFLTLDYGEGDGDEELVLLFIFDLFCEAVVLVKGGAKVEDLFINLFDLLAEGFFAFRSCGEGTFVFADLFGGHHMASTILFSSSSTIISAMSNEEDTM